MVYKEPFKKGRKGTSVEQGAAQQGAVKLEQRRRATD